MAKEKNHHMGKKQWLRGAITMTSNGDGRVSGAGGSVGLRGLRGGAEIGWAPADSTPWTPMGGQRLWMPRWIREDIGIDFSPTKKLN